MSKLKAPLFGLLVAIPCVGWALPGDTVQLILDYNLAHDSNYYRVANASQAQVLLGTENTAVTTRMVSLALEADLKFSRQNVLLRANVNQTTFDRSALQSQNGHNLSADWQWVIGNQWSGNLGYVQTRQLQSQNDSTSTQASVVNRNDLNFSTRYLIHPSFSLQASARKSRSEYSPISRSILDLEENTQDFGFRFISRAGNQIGLQWQHIDGSYLKRPAPNDQYQQSEISLQSDWRLGGHTLVHAQYGKTRREESQTIQQTPTWSVSVDWTPLSKSSLSAFVQRQVTSSDTVTNATNSVTRTQGLNGSWQLGTKIVLNGSITSQTLDYSSIARRDKMQTENLGLSYQPTTYLSLGLNYQIGRRDSNLDSADYQYRLLNVNIRGTF